MMETLHQGEKFISDEGEKLQKGEKFTKEKETYQ